MEGRVVAVVVAWKEVRGRGSMGHGGSLAEGIFLGNVMACREVLTNSVEAMGPARVVDSVVLVDQCHGMDDHVHQSGFRQVAHGPSGSTKGRRRRHSGSGSMRSWR